jgi:hypothetical protein
MAAETQAYASPVARVVSIQADLVFSRDHQIPQSATELWNTWGASCVFSQVLQCKIYTPFAFASVEGTEFLVAQNCTHTSTLSVIERSG